ncbi:MAG: EAL domain-containing protein [Eubacterium sp.]|nr:EAL domain-containing protein [Eubacterium sp.]
MQDEHLDHIISTMTDSLIQSGYKVLLFNSFSDFYFDTPHIKGEASIYHLINFDITDVLIIFPETMKNSWVSDTIVRYAKQNKCPVICVNGYMDGCTNINFDYVSSFEQVVRHVVEEHGCKKINFIAGLKNNSFSDERLNAFKKVMEEHGLPVTDEQIGYGDFWSDPTLRVLERFFAPGKELPEAIICANDSMAVTTVRFLYERGYKVPEDIIVTGFDAVYTKRYASLTHLTSAILDSNLLADTVAAAAERLVSGESAEDIYLDFSLTLSRSCGCVEEKEEITEEQLLEMSDYNFAAQSHESTMISYYATAISDDDFDSLTATLLKYSARFSWLCINDDFLTKECDVVPKAYHSVYTTKVTALQHRSDTTPAKISTIKTEELMPDFEYQLSMYDRFMFTPMHYQSTIMGYYCQVSGLTDYELHESRRFLNMTNQIMENFKRGYELKRAYNDLEMLHFCDPLTGVYNRRGFISAAEEMVEKYRGMDAFVFSCDMDKLKEINDKHGHTNGDIAIKETADAMKSVCNDAIICARFGGDEFILLGFSNDAQREAIRVADKIHDHLNHFNSTSGKPYDVSVSMGLSIEKADSIDAITEMLKRSDWKMYEQKEQKRGSASFKSIEPEENILPTFAYRIHAILREDTSTTYFYIDYIHFRWHVSENENTPKCMMSTSVNPLRAIAQSGYVYGDDVGVYTEFMNKIKRSFDEGIDNSKLSVNMRLTENGKPEWYTIDIWMTGNDERMNEIAGSIRKATVKEAMKIEALNFYKTNNPVLMNELIAEKVKTYGDEKMALIHMDIRRFKFINETYGEETGTDLLHYITRTLAAHCSAKQMSARISADLFMLLTPYEDLDSLTAEIRKVEEILSGFRNMRYEFSFGVFLIDDKELSPRVMGDRASQARISIKNNAIENIAFYDNKMLQTGKVRKFIEENMLTALENGEFYILLQPKFSISNQKALGFEALVRWKHETRGVIQPGEFIPLFEENGFIVKLDLYVWECACKVMRDWIDRGLRPLPISINVSRVHLKNEDFIHALDSLIVKYRLPKYLLEVEITESVENINTNRMMQEIKNHGYTLLMDDFGSGYSSLNTLKSTNFDVLKIDREFLSSFMVSEHGKKIISHTISMSRDIGLGLIAEGVETVEQADFLSDCGCDTAQGFLYARPMPVEEAEKYLETTR